MGRRASFCVVVARPGAGKTFIESKIIKHRIKLGDRAIIVDPTGQNEAYYDFPLLDSAKDIRKIPSNFKGGIVIPYEEPENDLKGTFGELWDRIHVKKDLENFNLILDDADVYAEGRPEKPLRNILKRARNHAIETWSTAHSLAAIPPFFFRYISMYGFMEVLDFAPDRKKMKGYTELTEVMNRVNSIREKTGNPHYIEFCDQFGRPLEKR